MCEYFAEANVPEELEDTLVTPKAGYKVEVVEEVDNALVTVEAGNEVEAVLEEVEKAGNEAAPSWKNV